ncbi:hypothetical protein ACX818_001476 [Acinetobacter baumannii]
MTIKLEKYVTVVEIKRPTRAEFFRNIKRGDQIHIQHVIGRHPYQSSSPWYKLTNMTTLERIDVQESRLINTISAFEYI